MNTNENRLIVVGSTNLDTTIRVQTPPRAGETVIGVLLSKGVGGKGANQAVAGSQAGVPTIFLSAFGVERQDLTEYFAARNVDAEDLTRADAQAGQAIVTLTPDGQNSIIVIPGANGLVEPEMVEWGLLRTAKDGDVVLLQAELPMDSVEKALETAEELGVRAVLNLAPYKQVSAKALAVCDPLILNETEAEQLSGRKVESAGEALEVLGELLDVARSVVITLGGEGAVAAWREGSEMRRVHLRAPKAAVIDTTGAGDAFCGALSADLVKGHSLIDAVYAGNVAGAAAVEFLGAQKPLEHAVADGADLESSAAESGSSKGTSRGSASVASTSVASVSGGRASARNTGIESAAV